MYLFLRLSPKCSPLVSRIRFNPFPPHTLAHYHLFFFPGASVLCFYKLSFPPLNPPLHPCFILLSGQHTPHPQGGDMCVMSQCVIPYHGDRSLAVSINMMEVGIQKKNKKHEGLEKGYDKVLPKGGGRGQNRQKSLYSHKCVSGCLCLRTHTADSLVTHLLA